MTTEQKAVETDTSDVYVSDVVELLMRMFKLRYNDPAGAKPFIEILENVGLTITPKDTNKALVEALEEIADAEIDHHELEIWVTAFQDSARHALKLARGE